MFLFLYISSQSHIFTISGSTDLYIFPNIILYSHFIII